MLPPHPSAIEPQLLPEAHAARGVHPQCPGTPPPPHVCPVPEQVPHDTTPPQRSGAVSQF